MEIINEPILLALVNVTYKIFIAAMIMIFISELLKMAKSHITHYQSLPKHTCEHDIVSEKHGDYLIRGCKKCDYIKVIHCPSYETKEE
jgi:hypothetical protein